MAQFWQVKTFKTKAAMNAWLARREGKIQYTEIFINNGFGVEWRSLRQIRV